MNTSVKSVVKALDEKNLKPDPVANLVNTSFKAGITLGRIFDVRYLLLLVSLWLSNHWSFKENLLIRKIT
jgi:hypothetical protein